MEAELRDGDILLSVRDTGVGIAEDELDAIFEEFTQGGEAKRRKAGSGLGLAICKQLAQLHGGRIEVESELGRGACFRVWLPVWKSPHG
jgi:signal transduction histidine kinase